MDFVNSLDFYREEFVVEYIKFIISGVSHILDPSLYRGNISIVGDAIAGDSIKFDLEYRNGFEDLLDQLPFNNRDNRKDRIIISFVSNFNSNIKTDMTIFGYNHSFNGNIATLTLYGNLYVETAYNTDKVDYLIKEDSLDIA